MCGHVEASWPQVAAWRVRRQHLEKRARAGSMLALASRLCGLHAQVMSCAELTLWARMEGLQLGALQRALWEDRTLVKTWAMRGTLHLLPASEFMLWQAALSANPRYLRPLAWKKHFGLTLDELDRLTEEIGIALDGSVMTREELARAVARNTGSAAFGRKLGFGSWGTILKPAAFTGRLCFGPSDGQRVRFTRPSSWLMGASVEPVDSEAAQSAVARRYLAVYGPATYRDLARWWGGGGIANAKHWIVTLGDEVTQLEVEGKIAWMLRKDAREAVALRPERSVRLLPAFDQYVVAASPHAEHLLPGDLRSRVYRPQGWLSPVLLVNGVMYGIWRHEIKGVRVELVIEPFVQLAIWAKRAAEEEAERLAEFLGGSLRLEWKK